MASRVGTTQASGGGTTTSRSWSHTLVGTADRVLTIWLFFGDSRSTVSAITVDGVDVSGYFVRSSLATGTAHGVLCYVVPGLAAGSRAIAVTYAAACENWYASDEAEDVDQTSPVRDHDQATGNSTGGSFGPTIDSDTTDLVYRGAANDSHAWTADTVSPFADVYNDSGSDGKSLAWRAGASPNVAAQGTYSVGAATEYAVVGISLQSPSGGGTVHDAAVAFSGVGTAAATATGLRGVAAAFAGVGTVAASARGLRAVAAAYAGVGTLGSTATGLRGVRATFDGTGTFAGTATGLRAGAVAFNGVTTFAASVAGGIVAVACSFSTVGATSYAASRIAHGSAAFAGAATISAAAQRIIGLAAAYAAVGAFSPTARALRAASVLFAGVGTFDALAEPDAEGYQGKYKAEHAGALADIRAAIGFSAEHAGARSDIAEAGR